MGLQYNGYIKHGYTKADYDIGNDQCSIYY